MAPPLPVTQQDIQAQPAASPARTAGSQARFCGRVVTKCGAHLIFGVGYAVSGFGVFYAVSASQPVMGGVCSIAICVQAVAHRWWSSYANVSRAAEDVEGAALDAGRAAIEIQNVAQVGLHIAGRVVQAANSVEQSSDRIAETIDRISAEDLQQNVEDVQLFSDGIAASTGQMDTQLESLRETLTPLIGIVGSFRTSLKEIHRGFVNAQPYIKEFEMLEHRFIAVQQSIFGELETSRSGFQNILKILEEEAILTLHVLHDQSRNLNDLLKEKNEQLASVASALHEMTDRSEGFRLGMMELHHQIEFERKENEKLKNLLQELAVGLHEEQKKWDRESEDRRLSFSEREKRFRQDWTSLIELLKKVENYAAMTDQASTQSFV